MKVIRSSLIIAVILLSPMGAIAQAFDPAGKIAELADPKMNMGLAAAVSVEGQILWEGSAGYECEGEKEFKTQTKTRIASIAKNLTAVAAMQMVEEGKIKLDDPIGEYLENLPEDKRNITLRQLLAHTSGISQYKDEKEIENTVHYKDLEKAIEVFIDRPLLFEPGSKYFYTSYGYVIIGRLIEEISKMTYGDYMEEKVFSIANMSNTGIEDMNDLAEDRSCLYHNNKKKAKAADQNDLSNRVPGGGFYSTVEDLMKFGDALLKGKLINDSSLAILLEKQNVEYEGNKYGLGWFLYGPEPHEDLVIGHGGGQTGCTSQLMIVPKSKTVVVVLSNTSGTYPEIVGFASQLINYSENNSK